MRKWANDNYREIMLVAMLFEILLLLVIVWEGWPR